MMELRKFDRIRMIIYLVIWILLFVFPILISFRSGDIIWNRVFSEWIRLIPFVLVFVLHHFLALPLLFSDKPRWTYFAVAAGILLVISWISPNIRILNEFMFELSPQGMLPPRRPHLPEAANTMIFYNLIMGLLLIGFDAALQLGSRWFKEEQRVRTIEKDRLQAELAFLRTQVSPHFFMNTLNNIHALIDSDQEKAKDAVIRLSKLMRYLLYETGDTVPLKKEFEFIQSYFDLMRMRYDASVKLVLILPDNIPEVSVPPLLTLSFLENAFKHGISYEKESFVQAEYLIKNKHLEFRISNSSHNKPEPVNRNPEPVHRIPSTGGLGLQNIHQQLIMLYNSDYILEIRNEENSHFVYLKIPLS